jgi:alpha-tubulin suppressor-like RCC1 family protein
MEALGQNALRARIQWDTGCGSFPIGKKISEADAAMLIADVNRLPARGLMTRSGTPVTGSVEATVTPLNVAGDGLAAFPGSFGAIRTDGSFSRLQSIKENTVRKKLEIITLATVAALALAACNERIPTGIRAPTRPIPGPTFDIVASGPAAMVSAGFEHTCAVRADGTIACWGNNGSGRATPPAGTFTQVSAGGSHTCGVRTDGTIACWGDTFWSQTTAPAGTFTQVSAGGMHTCGVRTNGTVACWSFNSDGQGAPPAGTFTQVSASGLHACAVRTDGTVACWGFNASGQAKPPAGTFTQVSGGLSYSCAVRTDGTIACWGDNNYSQTMAPAGTFIQLSAGNYHSCALRTDGTVACWGFGDSRGTPPAGTFTQVSAGGSHTCAVRTNGTVACWGDVSRGEATPPADLAGDETPPIITVPPDMRVNATSPAGAAVAYTVSASDNVGVASQSCAPASGSLFPIATTTVTCTASDATGNSAIASFAVTVQGADAQMTDLSATVEGLGLQEGTETSLTAKLDAAVASLAAGNTSAACGQLDAMINQITAQIDKKISAAHAATLIADINRIRAVVGC